MVPAAPQSDRPAAHQPGRGDVASEQRVTCIVTDGGLVVRDRPFEGAAKGHDQRLVEQAARSLRAEAQALVERMMPLRVARLDHRPQRGIELLDTRKAGRRRQVVGPHEAFDIAPLANNGSPSCRAASMR